MYIKKTIQLKFLLKERERKKEKERKRRRKVKWEWGKERGVYFLCNKQFWWWKKKKRTCHRRDIFYHSSIILSQGEKESIIVLSKQGNQLEFIYPVLPNRNKWGFYVFFLLEGHSFSSPFLLYSVTFWLLLPFLYRVTNHKERFR